MTSRLYCMLQQGNLSPLSYFFARFIADQYALEEDSLLVQSAALVSERNQHGDVCVELERYAGKPLFEADQAGSTKAPTGPLYREWEKQLLSSPCVGQSGTMAPLILDQRRLYLARLWNYEQQVQYAIRARLNGIPGLSPERLVDGLNRLFPQKVATQDIDWQKLASALAVSRRFAVISGGPGTGKTTTVVKVLALLLEQNAGLHIRLAAPTGKAAARLLESIQQRKQDIDVADGIKSLIPQQASTIHRLLGYGSGGFTHHKDNTLVVDCLVVDEASMVDLPLMARLLDALPEQARVILLGDRDQLASVEAGNVLGDITGHGRPIEYSPALARSVARLSSVEVEQVPSCDASPAVADAIALLRTSYRFGKDSGIGQLAQLVNEGQGEQAQILLQDDQSGEIRWIPNHEQGITREALDWIVDQYRHYLGYRDAGDALNAFEQTRVLCALHQGPFGVVEINRLIAERLRAGGLAGNGEEFHGQPVLITVNDYELDLYNGDIGLLWENEQGELQACFRQADNELRRIPLQSLPEHLPAWALTVHKSQGSEFQQVLLVLPWEEHNPIVSRELIYTGITRARSSIIVHASARALINGCRSKLRRSSGLAEKLGWPAE